jgi:hypothetical protein
MELIQQMAMFAAILPFRGAKPVRSQFSAAALGFWPGTAVCSLYSTWFVTTLFLRASRPFSQPSFSTQPRRTVLVLAFLRQPLDTTISGTVGYRRPGFHIRTFARPLPGS